MPASCTDDADCDTVPDSVDNCPSTSNPDQLNTDGGNTALRLPDADAIGDACDTDIDGDGYVNPRELTANRDAKGYCAVMRADLNPGAQRGNGIVNSLDLLNVALAFGPLTGDGRENQDANTLVNSIDLLIVALRFNETISGCPPAQPDDVAPPIDTTVATDIATSTAFLYAGTNPIQTGVAPGTIELTRAAVLRGKVLNRSDAALPGVKIAVLNHPEFGETMSRADGMFDLAVNGGGTLTIEYTKTGFLPAQRQVQVPWQDYAYVPDVVLIALDGKVSPVNLSAATPIQVAQADPVTDGAGTRTATLLFGQGTTATANGTPITNLSIRATEYTVGANGPEAMPAALPPTSGYTYAVEFSADEALGQEIQFSQPVYNYVDNFRNFPVGIIVPVGYYDRAKAAWIPSDNGRVIKILSITAGSADLDVTGDGIADTGAALTDLGVTTAELEALATLYAAGKSLWRVPISHFSTYDHNYGVSPTPGALAPQTRILPPEAVTKPLDNPCNASGSIIECENQTLGESLGIAGTPFSLNYRSDRTPGRRDAYTREITLSGDTIPPGVLRINLEVMVAGRKFTQTFPSATGQTYTLTWDGNDAYGRAVQGTAPATVRVGYVFATSYQMPPAMARSFGAVSGVPLVADPGPDITLWQEAQMTLGALSAASPVGGWSLSAHHAYEPTGKVLYLGDGSRRDADAIGTTVITTVAGNGFQSFSGDDGPATVAGFRYPTDVITGPDGSLYVAENFRIRRIGPNGIITSVAGNGTSGFSGDDGPATQAQLRSTEGIAVAQDGSLYIADSWNHRLRRVGPDGIITTVAGNGTRGFSGDAGPATQAQLNFPKDVVVGGDGSLYIVDSVNHRLRRVGSDGIITTVAGNGTSGFSGDGGPATQARLSQPNGVAMAPDGSLYIADYSNARIRRVGPDGIISTAAGNGTHGYGGDGGPAAQAQLRSIQDVAVAADSSVYIADAFNHRIRRIGPDGIITTVAGNGVTEFSGDGAFSGDGGSATGARLNYPWGLSVAPDGSFFIADLENSRIRRVAPAMPGLRDDETAIASRDGAELYMFGGTGRHLRTLDALTGSVLYHFGYDSAGRLTSITDGDGNMTTVERDTAGDATAIVAPFGQRTTLTTSDDGYLASVTNPADESVQLSYTSVGLLTSLTNPRNGVHQFTYDTLGRLIRDDEPAGGYKTLTRTETASGYQVAVSTALGHTTTHLVESLPAGGMRRVTTEPSGASTETIIGTDGRQTVSYADGTIDVVVQGPDPRWGMQAPIIASSTRTTPGGKVLTTSGTRVAALSNVLNPFSLVTLTDTFTISGRTSRRVYTASTRRLVSTSAANRVVTDILGTQGRVSSSQATGLALTTYTYDAEGRLSSAIEGTGPTQRTSTFTYGADGFLSSATDALGRTATFGYDAAGRVTSQTLPGGRTTSFSYDDNSNVSSITPPSQPAHSFDYTPRDLTSDYEPPTLLGGDTPTGFAYNEDGQPTQIARPDVTTVDFAYDASGRPASVTLPRGVLGYGYDAAGRLAGLTAPEGLALTFAFDGGLLTSSIATGPVAGSVAATYDTSFRVNSISVNGVNPIAFGYDNDDLITTAGALSLTRSSQTGLLTGTTIGVITDSRTYSTFGEPATYTASRSGVAQINTQYTRDSLGRITTKVENVGGVTDTFIYGYDAAGRLTSVQKNAATVEAYTYDLNGNRLTATLDGNPQKTATYDAQDRLNQYGTNAYAYTASGELSSKNSSGLITTYDYDQLGNLMGATLPGGPAIDYLIDPQNRRVGKKVNGALVQGFLYQTALQPIAELDGTGAVVSRFVYATNLNVPDYMIRGGVTYRIVTDHLGSPRLVLNTATGATEQRMDYDAFGNVIVDTNPGFQPFGFAGGLYDRDSGLVRFGARDYDPETGRWIVKDPIGFSGGDTNLYAYAGSDPIDFNDPTGLIKSSRSRKPIEPVITTGAFDVFDQAGSALDLINGAGRRIADRRVAEIIAQDNFQLDFSRVPEQYRDMAMKSADQLLNKGAPPVGTCSASNPTGARHILTAPRHAERDRTTLPVITDWTPNTWGGMSFGIRILP